MTNDELEELRHNVRNYRDAVKESLDERTLQIATHAYAMGIATVGAPIYGCRPQWLMQRIVPETKEAEEAPPDIHLVPDPKEPA